MRWLGVGFGVFWIILAVVAAYFNHGAVAIAWAALGGFCVGGASRGDAAAIATGSSYEP